MQEGYGSEASNEGGTDRLFKERCGQFPKKKKKQMKCYGVTTVLPNKIIHHDSYILKTIYLLAIAVHRIL